jgi:hypothetical protein
VSLNLWPQTAEKIVNPQGEVRGGTKQHIHSHGWRRQRGFLEVLVESDAYFWICSSALDSLASKGNAR